MKNKKKMYLAIIVITVVRYAFYVIEAVLLTITFRLDYNILLFAMVLNIGGNIIEIIIQKGRKQ